MQLDDLRLEIDANRAELPQDILAKQPIEWHGQQLATGALIGLLLNPPGFRWKWSIAQLRANRPPAYMQEFIRILAERPLLSESKRWNLSARNRSTHAKHPSPIATSALRTRARVPSRKSTV